MEILALALLVIFSLTGFIALFFTTFGTLIIFIGSILYALLTGFSAIGVKTLFILFTLYVCGEVLEYVLIIFGAKKFGASNAAIFGAFVGGILGAILGIGFFGVGLIAGAFLGMFFGAFVVELIIHRDLVKSLKAGTGSVLGRVGSIVAKVIISVAMFMIMASEITKSAIH